MKCLECGAELSITDALLCPSCSNTASVGNNLPSTSESSAGDAFGLDSVRERAQLARREEVGAVLGTTTEQPSSPIATPEAISRRQTQQVGAVGCLGIILFCVVVLIVGAVAGSSEDDTGQTSQPADQDDDAGANQEASQFSSFDEALLGGATCPELYEFKNAIDPKSPTLTRANDDLRRIGCFSISSTRTDDPGDPAGYSPLQYRLGYDGCTDGADQVYAESGTSEPAGAARWYAENLFTTGSAADGAYAGCLDALLGADPQRDYPP